LISKKGAKVKKGDMNCIILSSTCRTYIQKKKETNYFGLLSILRRRHAAVRFWRLISLL
jgi:hypothetical protein